MVWHERKSKDVRRFISKAAIIATLFLIGFGKTGFSDSFSVVVSCSSGFSSYNATQTSGNCSGVNNAAPWNLSSDASAAAGPNALHFSSNVLLQPTDPSAGSNNVNASASASWFKTFQIVNGTATGYLDFRIVADGTLSATVVNAYSVLDQATALARLVIYDGFTNFQDSVVLASGTQIFDEYVPYSGTQTGVNLTGTSAVTCSLSFASTNVNTSRSCTADSNFADTVVLSSIHLLDSTFKAQTNAGLLDSSGVDYNASPADAPEPSTIGLLMVGIAAGLMSSRTFSRK